MQVSHYKNIAVLGTSHIASSSVNEISDYIKSHKPDIVAVELDRQRLVGLLSKEPQKATLSPTLIFKIGVVGFLFLLIGRYVQKKLGDVVGMTPGADMKQAVLEAQREQLRVALIDQDISVTLRRLSKAFTLREKWRFFADLCLALVGRGPKVELQFDLKTVPSQELIVTLIGMLRERYPSLYRVLIDERNKVMARKLIMLSKKNPQSHILAVVGAGHVEGMMEYLKERYDQIEIT